MGTFKYRAKESSGSTVEGVIEAGTSEEAIDKINQLGYLPVKIEEASAKAKIGPVPAPHEIQFFSPKVKPREITVFSQQLSSLIRAGVPILRALAIIAEPVESPRFKSLLNRIHDEVEKGNSLSSALARYPALFSPLFLALVSAGESSGNLDQTLTKITEYRQKQEAIISHLRSALTYPILMALTGVGTIIFMLTFVMPRLMGIFSNLGGDLPLPTQMLIRLSTLLRKGWIGWVGVFAFLVLLLAGRRGKAQRLALSRLLLNLPLFGPLALKAEIARFCRTLELLLKSGIPLLKAIEVALPVVTNVVLRLELARCPQDLKEGSSFGKSLKKSKRFPTFMTNLIVVGEESGKLDEALSEIASFYERSTDEALRALTSLLEPVMILVMGLVVGFIVIAMLLPMFELNLMVR